MKNEMIKVGVIRFPGSNCDFDTFNFFKENNFNVEFIWHSGKEIDKSFKVIVLPGGFTFGDRVYEKATHSYKIDPGSLACSTNIMTAIKRGIKEKRFLTIGICNGFQILVKAGVLDGELKENDSGKFFCDYVKCKTQNKDEVLIPVAHKYGKYEFSKNRNVNVFLKYIDNINGSKEDVAGVSNKEENVFGMMPHPERADNPTWFFDLIKKYA